jgi:hypothetical protein
LGAESGEAGGSGRGTRDPEIQAVCVVLKARAKRGKVFGMRALAVQEVWS